MRGFISPLRISFVGGGTDMPFYYKKFKGTKKLKRSGMAGIFSATLELTKEGLLNLMQKKSFDKVLIKERKWKKEANLKY